MSDLPFWSDSFDMDLPKVIPGARAIVGDLGPLTLWTVGGITNGRLNHPCVWNGDKAMLAFFGFDGAARPRGFTASKDPVACTVWEALRDAWPHSYLMHVELRAIWNTFALRGEFETIMAHLRWGRVTPADHALAVATVTASLQEAVRRLRALCQLHGKAVAA